jgi:DNA-directed RNA polymerase subunit RPC12/RpoP
VEVNLAHFDGNPTEAYEQFEATSLYCPQCKEAVPVRKKLLLILPKGDEYEYLCTRCGSSVGIKLEKGKEEVGVLIKP